MTPENGDPPFNPVETPSLRMHQRVQELLDRMCTGDQADLSKYMPALQHLIMEEGAIEALEKFLDSVHPMQRLFVAGTMLAGFSIVPELFTQRIVEKSEAVLIAAMNDQDVIVQMMACSLLSQFPPPERALPRLRELVKSSDEQMAIVASLALSQSSHPELEAFRILTGALDYPNESLAGMAAGAVLRMGAHRDNAISIIKERFAAFPSFIKQYVLLAAKDCEADAAALFDDIAAIVVDDTADPSLRKIAAWALGSVSQKSRRNPDGNLDRAVPLLLKTLRSKNWVVVQGAIDGLAATGEIPQQAVDVIATYLSHARVEFRGLAAHKIATLEDRAVPLIPILIRRLHEEEDIDILPLIGTALMATGNAAVPALVDCIRTGNSKAVGIAGRVLASIGEDGARLLAELIPEITDERVYQTLLSTFGSMGRNAAPGVELLAEIMDTTADNQLAQQIAEALFYCGPVAEPAIPALVRCFIRRGAGNEHIGLWVKRALDCNRTAAAAELRQAMGVAAPETKERLQHLLSEIDPSGNPAPSRLSHLDTTIIERFITFAETMNNHSPNSVRGIAELIKADDKISNKAQRKGMSYNNLQLALEYLEQHLACTLTEPVTKKTIQLSAAGRSVLIECKEHLRSLAPPIENS